jgi:hypothetical protein
MAIGAGKPDDILNGMGGGIIGKQGVFFEFGSVVVVSGNELNQSKYAQAGEDDFIGGSHSSCKIKPFPTNLSPLNQ